MKHIFKLAVLGYVLMAALSACTGESSLEIMLKSVEATGVRVDGKEEWCLMAADGTILADSLSTAPTALINGVFSVYESDGIAVYKISGGKPALVGDLKGLRYCGVMLNGVMPLCKMDSGIEVVDADGNVVFGLTDLEGYNFNACSPVCSDHLFVVRDAKSGLWGAITDKGKVAVKPEFSYISMFNEGRATATKKGDDGKDYVVIIDKSGNVKAELKGYELVSGNFIYGHTILVEKSTRLRCVASLSGDVTRLPESTAPLGLCGAGIIFMDHTGFCGLMNYKGVVTVKPDKWTALRGVTGNKTLAADNGAEVAVITNNGEVKYSSKEYAAIQPLFGAKGYWCKNDSEKIFLFNNKFEKISTPVIAELSPKLWMSDILLSDRDNDHEMFNSADPGDEQPDWMQEADEQHNDTNE